MREDVKNEVFEASVYREVGKRIIDRKGFRDVRAQRVNGNFTPFAVWQDSPTSFKIAPGTHNGSYPLCVGVSLSAKNRFVKGGDFSVSWSSVDVYMTYSPLEILLLEGGSSAPAGDVIWLAEVNFDLCVIKDFFLECPQIDNTIGPAEEFFGNSIDRSINWTYQTGLTTNITWRGYATGQNAPIVP